MNHTTSLTRLSISLPKALIQALKKQGRHQGNRSMNSIINEALLQYFERKGKV